MIVNQNPFEGLVKVIVTLVVLGAVMGLLVTGTDWYQGLKTGGESQSAPRESQGPDVFLETAGQNNPVSPEKVLALEATRQRYSADNAYRRQRQAQDLRLRPALLLVLTAALGMGLLLLAGALAALILRAGRGQAVPARVNDPWKSPAYKAAQIELARRRESQARQAAPALPARAGQGYRRLRIPAGSGRNWLN